MTAAAAAAAAINSPSPSLPSAFPPSFLFAFFRLVWGFCAVGQGWLARFFARCGGSFCSARFSTSHPPRTSVHPRRYLRFGLRPEVVSSMETWAGTGRLFDPRGGRVERKCVRCGKRGGGGKFPSAE